MHASLRTSLVRLGWLVGPGLLLILAGACASSAPSVRSTSPVTGAPLADALRDEVRRWDGTPHVWGGTTKRGADCSGFVMAVYRDLLGIDLPRSTADQVGAGYAVTRHALRPGDLVFFRPAKRTRHVGIFLGDGEFAHVSSSRGVTISRLDEAYWRRAYWTARRLDVSGAGAPRVAATPVPQGGW